MDSILSTLKHVFQIFDDQDYAAKNLCSGTNCTGQIRKLLQFHYRYPDYFFQTLRNGHHNILSKKQVSRTLPMNEESIEISQICPFFHLTYQIINFSASSSELLQKFMTALVSRSILLSIATSSKPSSTERLTLTDL